MRGVLFAIAACACAPAPAPAPAAAAAPAPPPAPAPAPASASAHASASASASASGVDPTFAKQLEDLNPDPLGGPTGPAPTGKVSVELVLGPPGAEAALAKAKPRFTVCYNQALKADPNAKGTFEMSVVVDAKGTVQSANAFAEGGMILLGNCLKAAAAALPFPAGAVQQVRFRVTLTSP